jgi:hypothetical protein
LHFSNDKLRISITHYADYEFDSVCNSKKLKLYRPLIQPYANKGIIRHRNTIYTNKTTMPFFKSGLWHVNRAALKLEKIRQEFKYVKEFNNEYFERKEISQSENTCWMTRLYPIKTGYFLFIFYTGISHQEMTHSLNINSLEQLMLREYEDIFSTIRVGESY